jgi:hypothetical protein
MRRTAEIAFAAALVVVFAWSAYEARDWADNVRAFPLAVALPGLLLALVQVASAARTHPAVADREDEPLAPVERLRRTYEAGLWLLVFFAGVWLLGFVITIPLAALAYLRVGAREGWIPSVIVSAISVAFVFGVFDRLLHVPLPTGELIRILGLS